MRLIDNLDRGAMIAPRSTCLSQDGRTLNFRATVIASHAVAAQLAARGVGPGDVVATIGANSLDYMIAVLGIVRSGATWLPLNVRYAGDELRHSVTSNDCVFALCAAPQLDMMRKVFGGGAEAEARLLCIDDLDHGSAGTDLGDGPDQGPETIVAIRSTGGTTGPSKGVMISNRNYETLFATLFSTLPLPRDPVHLAIAPLSHAAGSLAWAMMPHGGRTEVMARFDAAEVLRRIESERVTHIFLTPTMLYMLLDCSELENHDYSSLHTVIYSGAPMSVEKLKRAIAAFGPVFAQAYGQAEAPFFCAILKPEDHMPVDDPVVARRLASCGRPTLFTRVEIMDDEGRLLGPGARGEIVVRGEIVMQGYYNNPAATEKAGRHGWHHTGDIGYKDEDGFLFIVDRERDVIISGGFNIFPTEIEQVIWSHPAVQDCAVIGVPDDLWGEAVKAVIELTPDATLDPEEIVGLCAERLGRMKAPKSVDIWPSLPRSPVGKVLKRDIRAKYWEGRDRAV